MLKRMIAVAACAALPLACGGELEMELEETSSELTARDGELVIAQRSQVADLELPNGSVLHFVEFAKENIAVLEAQAAEVASISSVSELPLGASLADVFYAFSEEGTKIPERILAASTLSSSFGPQGWARELLNQSVKARSNCTDSTFQGVVNGFLYNDRGTPDFRLNQVPRTSGYFDADHNYAPGNGQSYTFYNYAVGGNDGSVWSNVDRYYSRVAVCAIDTYETENPGNLAHPPISYQGYENGHMGPVVVMMYRLPGETLWHQAAAKDFATTQVGETLSWHFYTGLNWDWMTRIYWAGADDSFDIGHAVEDL